MPRTIREYDEEEVIMMLARHLDVDTEAIELKWEVSFDEVPKIVAVVERQEALPEEERKCTER